MAVIVVMNHETDGEMRWKISIVAMMGTTCMCSLVYLYGCTARYVYAIGDGCDARCEDEGGNTAAGVDAGADDGGSEGCDNGQAVDRTTDANDTDAAGSDNDVADNCLDRNRDKYGHDEADGTDDVDDNSNDFENRT